MTSNIKGALASGKKASDRRLAGTLLASGGLLFLLLTTAAESMYPNFSLQTNAISDLSAIGTPTTLIEETAILGWSISWILGAYYLFRSTGSRGLMILNLLPGIGALLAGLSPENVNIAIHSIGALLAFPFGAISALLSYRITRSPFKYLSVALGSISLIATFIIFVGWRIGPCGTCGYTQGLSQLLLGLGGWESMIIYPLLIWLIGFGSYLMAKSREGPQ